MGTKEKLIERFLTCPRDFTWDELVRLFKVFGYVLNTKGRTSGSKSVFEKDGATFTLHKPHPGNIIKEYVLKKATTFFKNQKDIK